MDPSWCPGCDKLILPKRYIVPVAQPTPPPPSNPDVSDPENDPNHPPPPPAPTPVPSSPQVRKKPLADPQRAPGTRQGNARVLARAHGLGGGLVHGTGRIRPGGGLKPRNTTSEPKKPTISPPKHASQPKAQEPEVVNPNLTATHVSADPYFPPTAAPSLTSSPSKKTRVVINQGPTPLYCSDECRARDLKNSFIDSDAGGFSGAPVAVHSVAKMERVQQTVERTMKDRRSSASSEKLPTHPPTPTDAFPLPILSPAQRLAESASLPPVPPNTLATSPPPFCRVASISSASSTSTAASSRLRQTSSKDNTIRASSAGSKARPPLALRSGSFSAWGSPSKGALVPPAHTLFTAGSSSSLESSVSSGSAASALFDEEAVKLDNHKMDGDETCATTPSRRGSGSSSKKQKRVSFTNDTKPLSPIPATTESMAPAPPPPTTAACKDPEWRLRRRRNPLLDANPLRDAVSVSPKDRVKASSLPSDLMPATRMDATRPSPSQSTSALSRCPQVVDVPSPNRTPRSSAYGIAMWPEDEKRTTESARVHGELLKGYAKRFGPREGRSLVWGRLWERDEEETRSTSSSPNHDAQPSSRRKYWRAFEEREAEARARRKAEAAVQREEEERVISELLGGAGMREEDQPQARRMRQMAYDGMPGPAELRGLTYKFDRFLYPLVPSKPTIVEKTIRRWDEALGDWVDETIREEVYEEKKRLFNFVE